MQRAIVLFFTACCSGRRRQGDEDGRWIQFFMIALCGWAGADGASSETMVSAWKAVLAALAAVTAIASAQKGTGKKKNGRKTKRNTVQCVKDV